MTQLPEGVTTPRQYKKSPAAQRGWMEGFKEVLDNISASNPDDLKRHQGATYATAYWEGRKAGEAWKAKQQAPH